jgi:dihydroorotate dehydrogenase electron transfer subunit
VSMEQTMGCAVGACMGCVVEVNDERKYARVCKEGPIFPGGYIKWH